MPRKNRMYTADFETTTDPNDCRVWGVGICSIIDTDDYHEMNNIKDFMLFTKKNFGKYYFHNLKFDGRFIVDWLLKNGFTYNEKPVKNTFSTVISSQGAWYSITIRYESRGAKPNVTTIYDSLKKLPFPVKRVATAFKLPILKGEIDYKAYRPVGHIITAEESAYIRNDVLIMALALQIQFEEGQTKMTIGSDALHSFKSIIGGDKNFKGYFPVLDGSVDSFIRKAYRGGFTWVNPKIQGKTVRNGQVYDVNSLYPYIMYTNLLPYGIPETFKGQYKEDKAYPLYIQRLRAEFTLKPNMIPTIQIKGSRFFGNNEYLESSKGEFVELYMTNEDMELFLKHYDIEMIEYLGGFKFMGVKGIFQVYIDKWTEVKMNNEGALRELAKLMLNNLYGKFATNPDVTKKIPTLTNTGKVIYPMGDPETKEPVYTAMGVFITAGARYKTISTAQSVYENICYCDTDSIHITGTEQPQIDIDDKKLGYWAHESNFIRAKFLRQKTYVEDTITKDGRLALHDDYDKVELDVKCAGMPDSVKEKVTFETFEVGFTAEGKLLPKVVSGGVVLEDTTFTIK